MWPPVASCPYFADFHPSFNIELLQLWKRRAAGGIRNRIIYLLSRFDRVLERFPVVFSIYIQRSYFAGQLCVTTVLFNINSGQFLCIEAATAKLDRLLAASTSARYSRDELNARSAPSVRSATLCSRLQKHGCLHASYYRR